MSTSGNTPPNSTLEPTADLRYPIGNFQTPPAFTADDRALWIATLSHLPTALRNAVQGWDESQFDTPYREGGWTVRQLLHHIADSHMQALSRYKLALTEDWPTVTPYKENLWAELDDSRSAPAEWSLSIIEAVHARWVLLLRSLKEDDWQRGFNHPERGPQALQQTLALYAWHSLHHTAHITSLSQRMGW